jgi:hypothetical protein
VSDQPTIAPTASPKVPIRSGEIRQAMLKRWCAPEYAIMWEVAPATGHATGRTRYADAVIMSLWPSRGLDLHGVEIKISRADWRREAADPTKAERIAAYCDFWWVHVAPGVIQDLSEVPTAWGVRVFDGKAWRTLREATRTEAKVCDRGFLAALLRRADEVQRAGVREAADAMIQADREAYEKRVAQAVESRTRHNTKAVAQVEAFEAASGLSLNEWTGTSDAAEIGRLVKAIRASGLQNSWDGLQHLRDVAASIVSRIETSMDAAGYPLDPIKPKAKGRLV